MSTTLRETQDTYDAEEQSPPVARMVAAVLALGGFLVSVYMYLYKLGIIPALACGAGGCDAVQSSPYAVFLGIPVPLLGILGYAAIFALAFAGIQPRFMHDRRIAVGLLGLCAAAAVFTLYLNYLEAFVIRAWCRWCIGSAIIVTALLAASLTEIRRLRRSEP